MKEQICMNASQDVLIRNKHDVKKLSERTLKLLKDEQQKRFTEALQDDDTMYINSLYNNISILGLIKILFNKNKKYTR